MQLNHYNFRLKVQERFLVIIVTILCLQTSFKDVQAASLSGLPRIVGGVPAIPGEFPWLVSIGEIMEDDLKPSKDDHLEITARCVGTILNATTILTATHCVRLYPVNALIVVAGAYNISANESTQQTVRVLRKFTHPNYTTVQGTSRNDIAILEISPLTLNQFVAPLRLPPPGHEVNKTSACTIAGWGQTETEAFSQILQFATIPIVVEETCIQVYPDLLDTVIQLCAGHEKGGYDACLYDSGGPLVCSDLGYNYVAGLVSWGFLCASPSHPSVYTKVSHYIDWLGSI